MWYVSGIIYRYILLLLVCAEAAIKSVLHVKRVHSLHMLCVDVDIPCIRLQYTFGLR